MGLRLGMLEEVPFESLEKLVTQAAPLPSGLETSPTPISAGMDPGMIAMLALPVDQLELSVRSASILHNAGISNVFELVQKTDKDILRISGYSRKRLKEIESVVKSLRLSLGMKLDDWTLKAVKANPRPTYYEDEKAASQAQPSCGLAKIASSKPGEQILDPEIVIGQGNIQLVNATVSELAVLAEKARVEINKVSGFLREGVLDSVQKLLNSIVVKAPPSK